MTQPDLFNNKPAPKTAGKLPALNPDGYSIQGCSHIYAPKGQAGEYAPLATNP